jgi:diguanylate cyclase (GGDEF)-like protein
MTELEPKLPSHGCRVLVGEDDAMYRRVLQSLLAGNGFDVTVVANGREALELACQPGAPRLLVLDWLMPGIYGPEICRSLRAHPPTELYQYILLLTAKDDKADTVRGLEAGADDYLTKPFDAQELLARLRTGARILELQDRLLEAKRRLEYQATHDPLTGLWSRVAWPRLLTAELQRARRSQSSLTVLMIDIDHFKAVNDQFGHATGDAVLREVADMLRNAVRTYDIAGRYGGEEFIVAAPHLSLEAAFGYADRIRTEIATIRFPGAVQEPSVSVSIGVAQIQAGDTCDSDALVRGADAALYVAKALGRNRVVQVTLPTNSFVVCNSPNEPLTVA